MNPLDQKALIGHVVKKWGHRFKQFGFDLDDLVQEGFIVCMTVSKTFDPSKGYAFSTYFVTSLNRHFLNLLLGLQKLPMQSVEISNDLCLLDAIEDESENPEKEVLAEAEIKSALESLSPLARLMAELMIDPPTYLREQFDALEAKRKMAQRVGVDERYPSEINSTFLASLLSAVGICTNELSKAKDELRRLESAHAV
ncbi:RNA polymerase factor sigma-32 [Ectopseudomonas mendocina]|uniref:RNA polymerase factor sigma-32 n=1 Tax=Ectopseudomonas mendocina TaxID=300 RepID=A0A379PPS9_ECTME|nr:sigma-70 family RNA polymerase sigma factor [Pseudomonas mendocina]SUE95844.1 RNA polymerase factor sigma-32 [Pseudomonas mendocina]